MIIQFQILLNLLDQTSKTHDVRITKSPKLNILPSKRIPRKECFMVEEIAKICETLSLVFQITNEYFNYHLVSIFAAAFITTLFNCYYILYLLLNEARESKVYLILFFSSQLIQYFIDIFEILAVTSELEAEVCQIGFINM